MPLNNFPVTVGLRAKNRNADAVNYDVFGQLLAPAAVNVRCAVVRFSNKATQTPLRAGESASKGRDEAVSSSAVLLFPCDLDIRTEDVVEIFGTSLRVIDVFPRSDVFGNAARGHLQVTLAGTV